MLSWLVARSHLTDMESEVQQGGNLPKAVQEKEQEEKEGEGKGRGRITITDTL